MQHSSFEERQLASSLTSEPGGTRQRPVSSMTGFARVAVEVHAQLSYALTMKSVNHRFLDVHLRLPSGMDELEIELRRLLKAQLIRGHVEVSLSVEREPVAAAPSAQFNRDVVASYVNAFRAAAAEFGLHGEPDLNAILRLPGVSQGDPRPHDEDAELLTSSVIAHTPQLLFELKEMRQREGAALAEVLYATLERLTDSVRGVAALRPEVELRHQERLQERLRAVLGAEFRKDGGNEISRQRMLEEVALLVERSDVSEEIARMETHIGHFRDVLSAGGETGKKLDFLLQEMNREANTLLSKTAGVAGKGTLITELGLAMKAEIEKAREQIQNLE